MWWGGFSEERLRKEEYSSTCLNPHVVGRFFRETFGVVYAKNLHEVLIPMWWGGFSESGGVFSLLNSNA